NGLQAGIWLGPCASQSQMDTVLSYVDTGVKEGAQLIYGGKRLQGGDYDNGYYVEPAIFDQVSNSMTIVQEEIFGPVIALIVFDELEEAIAIANDVKFVLSASIFTRSIGPMLSFVEDMDAGLV